jgi:hemoglobin-like flavoprotein
MTPQQLRTVRNFFAKNEEHFDAIVAQTFSNIFKAAPEAADLYSGLIETHSKGYARMLRKIIDLTRASHLWPVTALTGQAAIPGLGRLRERHMAIGIARPHYDIMKGALLQAMESCAPADYNAELGAAFGDLFDVLARSMTTDEGQTERSTVELETLLARHDESTSRSAEDFLGIVAAE